MNHVTIAAAATLPVLLAACAPEVESTLYLADILAVAETGEPIVAPALLRVPQAGEDECRQNIAGLVERLAGLAPVSGRSRCISKDQHGQGTQLAEIETELLIVPAGATAPAPNLFVVEVATTDSGAADLTLSMLEPVGTVIDRLQAQNPAQVDFDPSFFFVVLNNDTPGPVVLSVNHVFVDDRSSLDVDGTIPLARRETATIRFSDVASAHVEQGRSYWFATVAPAE